MAAGFGSQIALTLTRRIPGGPERIDRPDVYRRWLDGVSGVDRAETEVALRDKLPPRYWHEINRLLVALGQNICRPTIPNCSVCPVYAFCERVGVGKRR